MLNVQIYRGKYSSLGRRRIPVQPSQFIVDRADPMEADRVVESEQRAAEKKCGRREVSSGHEKRYFCSAFGMIICIVATLAATMRHMAPCPGNRPTAAT